MLDLGSRTQKWENMKTMALTCNNICTKYHFKYLDLLFSKMFIYIVFVCVDNFAALDILIKKIIKDFLE